MPTSRRLPPLAWRTRIEPRPGSRSGSVRAIASPIRGPARQRTTISAHPQPVVRLARPAHDGDDLFDPRRVGWVTNPLLRGGRPAWKPGSVAGERRRPAASRSCSVDMEPPLVEQPRRAGLPGPSEVSYYNSLVEIHPSARKHGIADEDIEHAMRHALAIDDQADDTRLYLGPSRSADLLEVATIVRDDGSEVVIHAMKMRPKYRRLLPEG